MDAKTVYQVAKALPEEGQKLLYDMLKKDLYSYQQEKKKNRTVLTEEGAIEYLLNTVFNRISIHH
ncbi:hypothetical protein G3567_11865 [Psychroflexus sp. YR1-1]|uniref:Uncharacterized protein n=1 Tax=Psychroflexus aurantiacus TaxID=2709310 RepID=A0A6B3RBD8_9FLAO|nr:hypothetical protein [Psychroflexus aurantiacus]NEV94841.1 hypothetical protein [Psychroflexus aurantiacus]